MAKKLSVEVQVGLRDGLSRPLGELTQRLRQAAASINRDLAKAGDISLVSGAVTRAGQQMMQSIRAAAEVFADAETAATDLSTSLMRAGGQVPPVLEAIQRKAEEMGDALPGSTADFLRMMTMLNRQGLDAQTILAGTADAAAHLAVILKMTPEAAAEFAAKLQDATGTLARDMPALADTIQRAFYLGVDPNNMLEAFTGLAPAMSAIKQRGLEGARAMAPLIAMLDQAGLSGGAAGNALAKVFTLPFQKADKIAAVNDSLAQMGLGRLQFSQQGEFAGLDNLFRQFEKIKALTTEQRVGLLTEIFGTDKETSQALDTLFQKGQAGYDEMLARQRAQASLTERVNAQLGTLTNLVDAATGTFSNLIATIGGLLAPEIKQLTQAFGAFSAQVRAWVKDNPQLARSLALWAAGISAAVLGLGAFLTVLAGLIGVLALTKGALAALFALLVTSPWTLAVKGVAALTAGLRLLVITVALTPGLFGKLLVVLRAVSVALLTTPLGIITALAGLAFLVYRNWQPIKGFFTQTWKAIQAGAEDLLKDLKALPQRLADIGQAMVDGLWSGFQARWQGFSDWVTELASGLPDIFANVLGIHSPSRVFAGIGGNIVAGLEQGMNPSGLSLPALARSGGPVNMPINITINAPAGADARDIARLVRSELSGATRQSGRHVGALWDGSDNL